MKWTQKEIKEKKKYERNNHAGLGFRRNGFLRSRSQDNVTERLEIVEIFLLSSSIYVYGFKTDH
jgi:hypothetical protein